MVTFASYAPKGSLSDGTLKQPVNTHATKQRAVSSLSWVLRFVHHTGAALLCTAKRGLLSHGVQLWHCPLPSGRVNAYRYCQAGVKALCFPECLVSLVKRACNC